MGLETKNTSKISDLLLLRLFPWVPTAFERICLMEESQVHFLTASDHPKWQSSEQKYLEENKPMPIIVLQIWMITWSYKKLSIQERKQSPQDMFRHVIYIFTCHQKAETKGPSSQASTIRLGINELKSLLAIEKHWFLKTNSH